MVKSLVDIPVTLATALAFHVSMTPPTSVNTHADGGTNVCTVARFVTGLTTKGLFWTSALTDVSFLLAPHVRTSLSGRAFFPTTLCATISSKEAFLDLIRESITNLSLRALSLPFLSVGIVGTTLTLTGAMLRKAAYNALGQFYACPEPGPCTSRGVRHAHALITTGPYAFVRHPGYAGLVLSTMGLAVLHLDVLKASHSTPLGRLTVGMRTVALACAVLSTVGALWRMGEEERVLKARFKGEWEAWAEEVRYRLVPGVY